LIYRWAKSRCQNPRVASYHNYGGRGIQFKFTSFDDFISEIGSRPIGYTLDRINNEGHYELGNIRWASRQEQNKNRRQYKTSTTGITGISVLHPKGKYKTLRYLVRVYIDGKRTQLYKGSDYNKAFAIYEKYT